MSSARTEIDFADDAPVWTDRIMSEIALGIRFEQLGRGRIVPHRDGYGSMAPSPAAFFVPTDYGVH